ncbi:UDP-N-acetylmuramoyl-L-alanyl-D-glutamate--2,6-diaminopimelate ligase [Corynebacterium lehmanniae]|uniref:UDP-N-acetylmuramoyl-L-alanyl-D-glutamate--2,6-diaminopimelate ligase n=1 Tax=Corynebacterium lehmanniae TaxID=2913497 RepID=A0ABT4RA70_9CORY|nr:UDP-N-acetylmuramoyl-L-alanyl-D-glutamate--2,6-diaminopimelate ligase [Corynebacterium lehmanniae]MCZ9292400.1 UDP-N-acetylmuramoyl-L-alanyl-D-glutamate--2,6-diaminopimelate ligase [Corynebacterium lehmanniae]MDL0402302.1 UDP-N-acetylmuramoyl-L-alanyl-D-glutamate--2,6-diaminopimelate ligase [Corynebacterium lehmanniae]
MTSLQQLADIAGARIVNPPSADAPVTFIGLDSQNVEPGGLFAALPGTRVHGATYAFDSAAGAILTDEAGLAIIQQTADRRPVLVVEDVRAILGHVAAEVYGHPSQSFMLLGVTGTSGKTTTTYMLEKGLTAAGCKVGLIGTTGTKIMGRDVATELTTPEAPMLQRLFAQMRDEGVTHVVMEVSSHALMLGRVTGSDFDVAAFTNLSQDHLDFHPTMEDYFQAKALFFDPASELRATRSVICVDDEWGRRMAALAEAPVTVATTGGADVTAELVRIDDQGRQRIQLTADDSYEFTLPMPGAFNVANAALAAAIAQTAGVELAPFLRGLEQAAVPGRMERIDEGQPFVAVVDYAHKPAAIGAVLATLRGQVEGCIGVAVGAGGDRDSSKRPLMGAEAAKGADFVVVTDDNPRTEDPAAIRAAVLAGACEAGTGAEIVEVGSRGKAIDALVEWARPGDAVIVVGKGHEVGQLVGTQKLHFDDREEMRRAITERQSRA